MPLENGRDIPPGDDDESLRCCPCAREKKRWESPVRGTLSQLKKKGERFACWREEGLYKQG